MGNFGDYFRNLINGDNRSDQQDDVPVNLPEKRDIEIIPRERPPITFDHGNC